MEEPLAAPALATAFPAPPPFWQSFTPDNLERIAELRAAETPSSKTYDPANELPLRILDLPPELRCLQPPEQPTEGKYRSFGELIDLNKPLRSLEEQDIEQLYTPPGSPTGSGTGQHADRAFILKKLAKSILLNFLELVGIMSVNAEDASAKIDDMGVLFKNFHYLLNEYRPHQARESLILMMQDQLDKSRAETQGIKDMKEKVEGILEGLSQAKLAEIVESNTQGDEVELEGKEVWDELQKEFD
ncbi:hypothetical protein EG329_013796 [Mollisiaceae sp. DMI_Dod_QoI]|nr:hypothetical protein EG329_013796 [Helotiales sp. DMI_Dod_QoI]